MSSRSVFAALASFSAPFKVIGTATEYVRRDEAVWSPSNSRFALAYSIAEVRMNNSIGCVLWGAQREQGTAILGNPGNVHACCWDMPWCV